MGLFDNFDTSLKRSDSIVDHVLGSELGGLVHAAVGSIHGHATRQ